MRRATGVQALVVCSTLSVLLAACGGRVPLPTGDPAAAHHVVTSTTSAPSPTTTGSSSLPTLPGGSSAPPTTVVEPDPAATAGNPTKQIILTAYETYLFDLSGLDDTLNKAYIPPLAAVTTYRLAEASVRQAAALLNAHEHGVGTLHDDRVTVVEVSSTSADITDCQDENDFYPVENADGAPDAFVQRGYFAGAAQLVFQGGHWLVDVFTTTRVTCTF
ncbi:MAG TPA: hypothetical protein VHV57_20440 [Acidimicrobiales bacterium]|nr:hypothetical protein [Acidimicrobiales bacterium]